MGYSDRVRVIYYTGGNDYSLEDIAAAFIALQVEPKEEVHGLFDGPGPAGVEDNRREPSERYASSMIPYQINGCRFPDIPGHVYLHLFQSIYKSLSYSGRLCKELTETSRGNEENEKNGKTLLSLFLILICVILFFYKFNIREIIAVINLMPVHVILSVLLLHPDSH